MIKGEEIHLLGYGIDWQNSTLLNELAILKKKREDRAKKIIGHLGRLDVLINYDELVVFAGKGTITRLHIANFLYNKKIVNTVYDAFEKYIGKNKPAYEAVNTLSAKEAIDLITANGGIPVYAHPSERIIDATLPLLMKYGLKGIEGYHSSYTSQKSKRYKAIAKKAGLVITGGSDYHGKGKPDAPIGGVKLPYRYVKILKECSSPPPVAGEGEDIKEKMCA